MTPLQLTRNVRSLNRLRQIAQVLTRHGFGYVVARLNLGRFVPTRYLSRRHLPEEVVEEGASAVGRRLAQVCTELGPTFIKLGQLLSTRPDIVPPEVLAELQKLQDRVAPFDSETARAIIEEELGDRPEACFDWIAETPFASASIGQVYRARTKEGRDVVVKVRRPGIEQTIRLDMHLLRWLAESLETLMPESRVYRPTMLVDELDQAITRELDYIHEASTTARLADAFADDDRLHVPRVVWNLTGPRVLTLEAVEGTGLAALLDSRQDTAGPIDRRRIARRLADGFLRQVFDVGCFHADPHPGNILVSPPATVALIDFGQVGTLGPELMTDVVIMTYAAVNQEVDVVVDTLADLGALSDETDPRALRRSLMILLNKYYGLPLKHLDVGTLFSELTDLLRRHDVVVPRDFSLLLKALSTLGTITRQLDPDLNLLELLRPRIRSALKERFSPQQVSRATTLVSWDVLTLLRRGPGQLRAVLRRIAARGWELHVRHENLDRLIRELDRSSNRLAFSIVIAAI
ncbi:MAG: hypothetical protein D6788_00465, partial [Planctomycetota bacterium]